MSLSLQTSKTIQIFLLSLILLLPGVDSELAAFIKWYLASANTEDCAPNDAEAQLPHHCQATLAPRDGDSTESTLDNELRLACEPVASSFCPQEIRQNELSRLNWTDDM